MYISDKHYSQVLICDSLACASLQHLHYSTGGSKVGPNNFNFPDLIDLLEPHKRNLQSLYLDLHESWTFEKTPGLLPPLCDFTALEKLDVDSRAWEDIMFGPDEVGAYAQYIEQLDADACLDDTTKPLRNQLPQSLSHLILRTTYGLGEWDKRQIVHLVTNPDNVLPNLQLVEIVYLDLRPPARLVELANTRMDRAYGLCRLVNLTKDDYSARDCPAFRPIGAHWRTRPRWQEDKYKWQRAPVFPVGTLGWLIGKDSRLISRLTAPRGSLRTQSD
jgi:hypothetical protein